MNKISIPIECNIPADDAEGRLMNWRSIQSQVSSVVQLKNGISAKIPSAITQTIRDFAAAEAECCPSMLFEITESAGESSFQITSEQTDSVKAIHSLFSEGDN
jgi:hypothetical protein